MVHLPNGVLCSRKKEGTPTFCDRERWIDLESIVLSEISQVVKDKYRKSISGIDITCKWNPINKTNKQAK